VAKININGMSAEGRLGMLNEIIHKQEIDIILLREVTDRFLDMIRGYTPYLNVGKTSEPQRF